MNRTAPVLPSVSQTANASLSSSSQSTDESSSSVVHLSDNSSSTKAHLFQRMISLGRSSTTKPSIYRSYNLRALETAQDYYSIVIHFLDETERTFYVDCRCKGIDLFNEVFDYLDLSNERKYFGLLVEDITQDFAHRWLESSKTLKKQLATHLSSYQLYVKVRFFLPEPSSQLDDEFTRYLYVLQLKKELLSGKIWCPRSTAASLASYIVQSELGDYDPKEHRYGYLSEFRFVPFQNSDFENEVQQHHKQHKGQSPADTEVNYLRVASTLDMYGVELHKASVRVTNSMNRIYQSIVELYIGVCANGISIFQNSTKINIFSWDQITKISFKRRTFYIQLLPKLNSSTENSIVFTLRNYRCCKYLWKSCVDHHTFFRLTSLPSSPKRFFQFTNKFRHSTDVVPNRCAAETKEKKSKIFERASSRRNSHSSNPSSTLPVSSTLSRPSPRSFTSSKSDQILHTQTSPPPPPKPPRQPWRLSEHVEGNALQPPSRTEHQHSSPDHFLSKASEVSIKLHANIDGRYGFNIKVENQSTMISRIARNTPAYRAALQEGDIILAINNVSIRNYSPEDVINMIRNSRELELLVKPLAKYQSLQILREDLTSTQLIDQYEKLQRRKDGLTFEIANQSTNSHRNRYKDVLPYDQTRVILTTDPENDYINANHIDMPILSTDTVNRYIATQGPLPTTCEAFWRMIWEADCRLIIMLTTLFENGRIKCHQYWPSVLETSEYGLFTIRCSRERKENELIYRELMLVNQETKEERVLYQIQNEIWPDHGVPKDYSSFIEFVLEIRELRKANKHLPILVHCSAGIGRTGVLILMETALCLIENNQPVFPLNIVREMREQRSGMIQTASQYQFACEAILYAYDHGLIELNIN